MQDFRVLSDCLTANEMQNLKNGYPEVFDQADSSIQLLVAAPHLNDTNRNRKIHDIRASFRTLNSAVENLNEGYRFADDHAALKILAITSAVKQLESYSELLEKIYSISHRST
jgi:hypothetical protein